MAAVKRIFLELKRIVIIMGGSRHFVELPRTFSFVSVAAEKQACFCSRYHKNNIYC